MQLLPHRHHGHRPLQSRHPATGSLLPSPHQRQLPHHFRPVQSRLFRCHHNIDLEWIKLCARISHCTQNSSPVCVFSKDCTFRQVGSDDRLCKHLCCLLILRVFHLHLEQTACPLSVTGDLLCKISIDCKQCLLECL